MNIPKRGIIYIKRNAAQSIVLFITIFLLGIAISSVVSIDRAIEQTEENLWRQLPTIVSIEEDWLENELYWQEHGIWPAPPITRELIEALSAFPYVQTANLSIQSILYSRNLELSIAYNRGVMSLREFGVVQIEIFPVKGVSQSIFPEISNNAIEIIHGETFIESHFTDSIPVALVSTEFAIENDLVVGSLIQLESLFVAYPSDVAQEHYESENITDSLVQEFEVIGIFESRVDTDELGIDLTNRIYMPYTVLESMVNFQREAIITYFDFNPNEVASFFVVENFIELANPRYLSVFREEVLEILPNFLAVRDLSDSFEVVVIAMENIRSASVMILFLVTVAGILILSLVISLFLRNRRHEIGIYLALGERKRNIFSQLFLEISLLTGVAVILSIVGGFLVSNQISHWLLVNEINTVEVREQSNRMFDGILLGPNDVVLNGVIYVGEPQEMDLFRPTLSPEDMRALFDTSLNNREIVLFSSIVIVTVLVSMIVPVFYIMRLAPKKILM